jgi:hypothetical protein
MNFIFDEYNSMVDKNNFIQSIIPKICLELDNSNVNYCLVGGATLPFYKYNRATDNLDVLISRDSMENLTNSKFFKQNFEASRTDDLVTFKNGNLNLNVILSGTYLNYDENIYYKEPTLISKVFNGLKIISLPNLICYKIADGIFTKRTRHFGDVEELIKNNSLPLNFSEENNFNKKINNHWKILWENAKFDMENKR